MKIRVLILLLLFGSLLTTAQDTEGSTALREISDKIRSTDTGERLKWMDSLATLTYRKSDLGYDSIVRATIEYALELDSNRLALFHGKKLVSHIHDNLEGPEKAIEVFDELKDRIPESDDHIAFMEFYNEGAYSHKVLNRLEDALRLNEQAYTFAVKSNDSTEMGTIKNWIGELFCFMGDFQKAATTLEEAHQILSRHDPEEAWEPLATLSILYSQNGLQEEAKKLRMEIIVDARRYGNMSAIHNQYFNQAFDEMLHGSQKERMRYLDSARTYSFKTGSPLHAIELLIAQLSAYSENGLLEKAETVKKELEERLENIPFQVDEYNLAMAHYQYAKGNYENALMWGEREYKKVKDAQFYEGIYMAHDFLSKVHHKLGDLKKAYYHFQAHHKIKDSIESVQKANGFSFYQTLYETEKRDAKIEAQSAEITILDSQNRLKNQWIIFGGLGLVSLFSIFYLIRSRNFARNKQLLLAQYSQSLIKGQEEERTRLARELHDSVGQKLMLLTKKTKSVKNTEMESLADNTLKELRSISRGLRPVALEQLDITKAIQLLIDEIDANTDIFFTHEIDQIDSLLDKESSLHLYRILQEALSNMVKHAEAKAASVTVRSKKDSLDVLIQDNGKGFNFEEKIKSGKSLGMRTLLERAKIMNSKLHVKSEYGHGTTISLNIPIVAS